MYQKPTPEEEMYAYGKEVHFANFQKPSNEFIIRMLEIDPRVLKYIPNPTNEMMQAIIRDDFGARAFYLFWSNNMLNFIDSDDE